MQSSPANRRNPHTFGRRKQERVLGGDLRLIGPWQLEQGRSPVWDLLRETHLNPERTSKGLLRDKLPPWSASRAHRGADPRGSLSRTRPGQDSARSRLAASTAAQCRPPALPRPSSGSSWRCSIRCWPSRAPDRPAHAPRGPGGIFLRLPRDRPPAAPLAEPFQQLSIRSGRSVPA